MLNINYLARSATKALERVDKNSIIQYYFVIKKTTSVFSNNKKFKKGDRENVRSIKNLVLVREKWTKSVDYRHSQFLANCVLDRKMVNRLTRSLFTCRDSFLGPF